jgi:hypothetical protein
VAVSGVDYSTTGSGRDLKVSTTPFGLHVLDTSTWTSKTLDPAVQGLVVDGSTILATAPGHWSAYSASGAHLYDVAGPDGTWLTPARGRTYVCTERWLTRVLDSATGVQIAAPQNRGCPTLLAGRAAQN